MTETNVPSNPPASPRQEQAPDPSQGMALQPSVAGEIDDVFDFAIALTAGWPQVGPVLMAVKAEVDTIIYGAEMQPTVPGMAPGMMPAAPQTRHQAAQPPAPAAQQPPAGQRRPPRGNQP